MIIGDQTGIGKGRINQMLFSIKAEAVAERAIARLKEGKKPVVAFASTIIVNNIFDSSSA
jgi:hypothetical protein